MSSSSPNSTPSVHVNENACSISATSSTFQSGTGMKMFPTSSITPILDEPKRETTQGKVSVIRRGSLATSDFDEAQRLRKLSSLSVSNQILITTNASWCKFSGDIEYQVFDTETNGIVFLGEEPLSFLDFRNLHNILVRDHSGSLVGRVCYRESSTFYGKLMMAVYSPVDIAIGTISESKSLIGSIEFLIRDSDGKPIYYVEYQHPPLLVPCFGSCGTPFNAHYEVKSYETKLEIGKILEKTNKSILLQFTTKLDIIGKLILTGFCIGMLHKPYNQQRITQVDNSLDPNPTIIPP